VPWNWLGWSSLLQSRGSAPGYLNSTLITLIGQDRTALGSLDYSLAWGLGRKHPGETTPKRNMVPGMSGCHPISLRYSREVHEHPNHWEVMNTRNRTKIIERWQFRSGEKNGYPREMWLLQVRCCGARGRAIPSPPKTAPFRLMGPVTKSLRRSATCDAPTSSGPCRLKIGDTAD
jgi:hypothetical protein